MKVPALKNPNECLEGLWKRVPGHIRLTYGADASPRRAACG